ncbi:hypothetical protein Tco_1430714 [Tanacetum coccineum]
MRRMRMSHKKFEPPHGSLRFLPRKRAAHHRGKEKKKNNSESTNEVSMSNPFEVLTLVDNYVDLGKLRFVNNDGNPLVPAGIVESDSEVEVVFDETANLRISTSGKDGSDKGYGTNSLLEQWMDSYPDNDDYDPYDDDMYENHDMSEHLQSICDDLDITDAVEFLYETTFENWYFPMKTKRKLVPKYIAPADAASYRFVYLEASINRHQQMPLIFTNNVVVSSLNNHGAHVCDVTDIDGRCRHALFVASPFVIVSQCQLHDLRFMTSGDATTTRIHRRTIDIQNLRQETDATPILNIERQWYEDPEKERTRNHFPFDALLEVDLHNYKRVRFIAKATIYKINTQKKWYYQKCATCGKKASSVDSIQKQTAEPASPILLAIPKNESQIVEIAIKVPPEEQYTPPSDQQTMSVQKGNESTKLPEASTRNALFENDPEVETEIVKKLKHDSWTKWQGPLM